MCVRNALSSLLPYGLTGVRKCRFHGGMETPRCPRCGGQMKKNGKTSAGRTRWRCKDTGCGASRSRAYAPASGRRARLPQLAALYRQAWEHSDEGQRALLGLPARYGTGIDWNESHTSTPWRNTD